MPQYLHPILWARQPVAGCVHPTSMNWQYMPYSNQPKFCPWNSWTTEGSADYAIALAWPWNNSLIK